MYAGKVPETEKVFQTPREPHYLAYMVNPREYLLNGLWWGDFFIEKGGWHFENNLPSFGYIHAEPGEIVYIGDIQVVNENGRVKLLVHDHTNEALKYLSSATRCAKKCSRA